MLLLAWEGEGKGAFKSQQSRAHGNIGFVREADTYLASAEMVRMDGWMEGGRLDLILGGTRCRALGSEYG